MQHLGILISVFIGGGLGAVSRVSLEWGIEKWVRCSPFPWGIFCINLIGCLGLGLLSGSLTRGGLWIGWVPFLGMGFLGAFTTFSTFSLHLVQLLRDGHWGIALTYMLSSVLVGVALAALGFYLGKSLGPSCS